MRLPNGCRRAHVMPTNDLVAHEADEECVCGPTPELVRCNDGGDGWVFKHHSLTGQELRS